jgi:hypothetical protein
MAFDTTTYLEPFWAKSADFVRGRDPLGIQNSSITVYSLLLPGMTNLTLRLRYYGFYLWLLDEYHNLAEDSAFKTTVRGQYNFIRRAELILSYFMVNKYPAEQSVVGSNFAFKYIADINTLGYYDIALGADKFENTVKHSVYWDYTSGAFGQYYSGSLMALQLVDAKTGGYFERTEKGKKLADSFRDSIQDNNSILLFLERINEGKLYTKDIDLLTDFALNKDLSDTNEEILYSEILLDYDGLKYKKTNGIASNQRKDTLLLFLNYVAENKEKDAWKGFPMFHYTSFLENHTAITNETHLGWYYYYLNELVHFSLETVFWAMLVQMENKQQSVSIFIESITKSVIEAEQENFDLNQLTVSQVIYKIANLEKSPTAYIENIYSNVKSDSTISGLSEGLFLLLKTYHQSIPVIDKIEQYAADYALFDKNGNALHVFKEFITSNQEMLFPDFIRTIIKAIINDHTAIAYRKTGNGEKNLLKFIIEDNYLIHIETMTPNFTSPRIKTLYNFLVDLGLITTEGDLSTKANQLISTAI